MYIVRDLTKLSLVSLFAFTIFFVKTSSPVFAAGNLFIVTNSINDNGGNWNPSDFSVSVKLNSSELSDSPSSGLVAPGKHYIVQPGTYTVSAGPYEKYSINLGGDCDASGRVAIANNETKTCNVSGNDKPATLHVITEVTNDNGGSSNATNFKIHVKAGGADVAGSPSLGTTTPGTSYELTNGTFNVSVEENPTYTQTIGGDCDSSGNVTLPLLGEKTCIISINDTSGLAPRLPNTGNSDSSDKLVCIKQSNMAWIVAILALIIASYFIYKKKNR